MSDAFNNLDFHKHVDMKVKELEKNFAFQTHCTEYLYTEVQLNFWFIYICLMTDVGN